MIKTMFLQGASSCLHCLHSFSHLFPLSNSHAGHIKLPILASLYSTHLPFGLVSSHHLGALSLSLTSLASRTKSLLFDIFRVKQKEDESIEKGENPKLSDLPSAPSPPPPSKDDSDNGKIKPEETAVELIKLLEKHDHLSFIAGGWVRDRFMGKIGDDVDICSTASVEELTKILGSRKVSKMHENTARVTYGRSTFEVTRFKGFTRDKSNLATFLDAKKRDFTINSLLYDPIKKKVLDYCGGVKDIKDKVLRMNSTPRICHNEPTVLQEDPVRILRGVRFAVQFGLEIEPNTLKHMRDTCFMSSVTGPLHYTLPLSVIRMKALELAHMKGRGLVEGGKKDTQAKNLTPPDVEGGKKDTQGKYLTPPDDYAPERKTPRKGGLLDFVQMKLTKMVKRKGTSQLPVIPLQGLDPEAKAGRVWRELIKIESLSLNQEVLDPATITDRSSSNPARSPFAQALLLFKQTGLLLLLFPFLKNVNGPEAFNAFRVHSDHLPQVLSSLSCSQKLPLELRVMGLMDPFHKDSLFNFGKAAYIIQGVEDLMTKFTPRPDDEIPDMDLVKLYLEAVNAVSALGISEERVSMYKDLWIKLLSHPYSDQIVAVMTAWMRIRDEGELLTDHELPLAKKKEGERKPGRKHLEFQKRISGIKARFKSEIGMAVEKRKLETSAAARVS